MAVYAYRALDASGQPCDGMVTADTPALARQLLRTRGLAIDALLPAQTHATNLRATFLRWPGRGRRRAEQAAELWRNLAVLLEAGVPLAEALQVCIRQQTGAIQSVLRQIHEALCNGQPLTEALRRHSDWFDELTLAMIEVGRQSGALPAVLGELAEFQSRQRALADRLGTVLIYPCILCCVGLAVVIFLMSHVVPQLVDVLQSAGRELPAPTRLLKNLSDGLVQHGLLLAASIATLLIGGGILRRTPRGRRLWEGLLLHIPLLGDLIRKAWVARISLMLTTMLRAEVRFVEAVRIVRKALPHRLFADELEKVETAVQAGVDIAEPLRDSRLIPPLVVQLLAVGQESGELPRMLEQLRIGYEKEVQLVLGRFLAALEPTLILILAAVIGFVVFATLLPILETTRMVQ